MREHGNLQKGQRRQLWADQDSDSKLNPEMLYWEAQFVVNEADWAGHGEGVVLEG